MEVCYKCGRAADYICPDCGTKVCRAHMELRYVGPDRGFKSRYMCPECWKGRRTMLNEQMIMARERLAKHYFFFSRKV
jgi:predicted RNA-binding Zn-ribbon protein involved in translation (DUF1610 family)